MRQDGSLRWVQWLFVAVYAAYGTTAIFRVLYYRRLGLTGAQIGLLIALEPMVTIVSGPLWSMLADRAGLRDRLLTFMTVLSAVPLLAMIWLTSWPWLVVLTVLHAAFRGPIQPLTDSSALAALGAKREQYGRVRALGSLSYALVVWATGVAIEGRDLRWIFPAYAVLMVSASLLSLRVRSGQGVLPTSIRSGLGQLVRDSSWVIFVVAFFVSMMLQAVAFNYNSLYLDGLGAAEGMVGLSGALASLAQTALLLFMMPRLLRRWGSEPLLLAALALFGLGLAIWSLVPLVWAVAASTVVMGCSFVTALVAAVDFADRHAPPGLATTSQALTTGLMSGMGQSAGGLLAGSLYDGVGPQVTFGVFSVMGLAAVAGFVWLWRGRAARPMAVPARD